jgi:hypothetical protein
VDAVSQWDYVHLRVDGPYGAGSEHVFDYEVAVLVGAGIGVTPFASIVKSARLQMQQASAAQQAKMRPQRIYFYWCGLLRHGSCSLAHGISYGRCRERTQARCVCVCVCVCLSGRARHRDTWAEPSWVGDGLRRVCRDMQEFNWFSPLLQECGDDMKGLEINTYMTGELNLVRTQLLTRFYAPVPLTLPGSLWVACCRHREENEAYHLR